LWHIASNIIIIMLFQTIGSLFYLMSVCYFLLLLCHMCGWWLSGPCKYDKWTDRKWQAIVVR
jgi:nicotinamide riboside transporter PnuC